MPNTTRPSILERLHPTRQTFLALALTGLATIAAAAEPRAVPSSEPQAAIPADNPLRSADESTQKQARADAWITFQRACRPCHGSLGGGDGPHAQIFERRAADLRRPSRDMARDAVRFERIRDGAASLATRPWESGMPAFGGELDDRQIWGLVLLLEDFGKDATGLDPSSTGADVYAARCAVCHGASGAGDGPLAEELLPAPRNFVRAAYRLRWTASGAQPIDTDMLKVIAHGYGDTSMGRFLTLGGIALEDVVAHLRTFAPELFAKPAEAVGASPLPAESLAELATRGQAVYEKAGCAECHGKQGRGDGAAAAKLKDDSGRRSITTDLTKRWQYKTGSSVKDIYRTLTTGMDGTPMSSFGTTLSGDDRWAVAHYLDRVAQHRPKFSPTVQAGVLHEPIPLDPSAAVWKAIPRTSVPLGPQVEIAPYWTQPAVDAVDVTVAVNDQQLAILIVWDDRSRDVRAEDSRAASIAAALARHGSWHLPDRIALQFPEKPDPKGTRPPVFLGAAGNPVVRWSWSAERYEGGDHAAAIERIAGPQEAPVAVSGAAPVETVATYADGQWRVLMLGTRPPKSQTSTAMVVHAWDGASGETELWQSFSGWITVKLD